MNVTDQSGQTALSHACKQGNLEVVHQLLAAGSIKAGRIKAVRIKAGRSRQVGQCR